VSLVVLAAVGINGFNYDDPGSLPGLTQLKSLISSLATWSLFAALAGMVVGAVLWAVGHHSSNYQQAYSGRKGVMISGAAAIIIGAAPRLIDYFYGLGQAVSAGGK
jgi:hypothetical protein